MPFGFLKSAISSASAFAGNAMASFVPKITSIVTPTIAIPSMSTLGANLVNQAKGMATQYALGKVSGFTSGISSKLTGMVSRGVQSVIGRIPSGYTRAIDAINILQEGSVKNIAGILGGQYSAQANDHFSKQIKSLVSKSPYNFDALSEKAHLKKENNPFKYGMVHFPQEVSNLGDGHYIIFDILTRPIKGKNSTQFSYTNSTSVRPGQSHTLIVGESRRKSKVTESNDLSIYNNNLDFRYATIDSKNILENRQLRNYHGGSHRQTTGSQFTISDTIVLGMPKQNHTFDYSVSYEQDVATGLTGAFKDMLEGLIGGSLPSFEEVRQTGGASIETLKRKALETLLPSYSILTTLDKGFLVNPNMESAFKSVPMRAFTFDFDLTPKNEQEKDSIDKIIKLFKFHMLPDASDKMLLAPSEFQITYAYRDNENEYIPKISRCALSSAKFDYAPDQNFHTFYPDSKGAPPISTKMSLTFNELEIMTKETVAAGY